MECPDCELLIHVFADAATRYFAAVDHLSNVVESRSHHHHDDHKRLFFEALARARHESENCVRARVALTAHRSELHLQVKP